MSLRAELPRGQPVLARRTHRPAVITLNGVPVADDYFARWTVVVDGKRVTLGHEPGADRGLTKDRRYAPLEALANPLHEGHDCYLIWVATTLILKHSSSPRGQRDLQRVR
jgi:hypothetical protein